jgi:hypothetical protein
MGGELKLVKILKNFKILKKPTHLLRSVEGVWGIAGGVLEKVEGVRGSGGGA